MATKPVTSSSPSDSRADQILAATVEVIIDRGFPETRIADVAERAGVSPALVIYYFKTRASLLAEAMRRSESDWYGEMARRVSRFGSAAQRLEEVVAMTCLPPDGDGLSQSENEAGIVLDDSWVVWLDLWSQALREPHLRRVREEFDEHFRATIRSIVEDGLAAKEFKPINVQDFAITFAALLDGLAIQITLDDPAVSSQRAFELAMAAASRQLGFAWAGSRDRAGE